MSIVTIPASLAVPGELRWGFRMLAKLPRGRELLSRYLLSSKIGIRLAAAPK